MVMHLELILTLERLPNNMYKVLCYESIYFTQDGPNINPSPPPSLRHQFTPSPPPGYRHQFRRSPIIPDPVYIQASPSDPPLVLIQIQAAVISWLDDTFVQASIRSWPSFAGYSSRTPRTRYLSISRSTRQVWGLSHFLGLFDAP